MTFEKFISAKVPASIAKFEKELGGSIQGTTHVWEYPGPLYIAETEIGFEWCWVGPFNDPASTLEEAERKLYDYDYADAEEMIER